MPDSEFRCGQTRPRGKGKLQRANAAAIRNLSCNYNFGAVRGASNRAPRAEGRVCEIQLSPEFVETYIAPSVPTATSVIPSAAEATAVQSCFGALVWTQVAPQSGDV